MGRSLLAFFTILCLIFICNVDVSGQVGNEQDARNEIRKRGIDEEELRKRLLEKGIDVENLQNLSSEEAIKIQSVIEETIAEMEAEVEEKKNRRAEGSSKETRDSIPGEEKEDPLETATQEGETSPDDYKEVEIFGQHIFRNRSIKVYKQSDDIKPPPDYVMGVGDEVIVQIWGRSRLDERYEINENGYIAPSRMPRIFLKGFTYRQLKNILRERFKKYYRFRNSEFDVAVNYSRSIEVNIFGEVYNYGGFTLPAINTAFNALVAAGGPTDIGSVRKILLRRGGTTKTIDVYKFIFDPSVASDYYLQNNDIIQVPAAGDIVEIKGQVRRPFKYELIKGEGIKDLVKYAGGFGERAVKKNIQVWRYEDDKQIVIDVPYASLNTSGRNFELTNGDIVWVDSITNVKESVVFINGEVFHPGEYERSPNMRLTELLKLGELRNRLGLTLRS